MYDYMINKMKMWHEQYASHIPSLEYYNMYEMHEQKPGFYRVHIMGGFSDSGRTDLLLTRENLVPLVSDPLEQAIGKADIEMKFADLLTGAGTIGLEEDTAQEFSRLLANTLKKTDIHGNKWYKLSNGVSIHTYTFSRKGHDWSFDYSIDTHAKEAASDAPGFRVIRLSPEGGLKLKQSDCYGQNKISREPTLIEIQQFINNFNRLDEWMAHLVEQGFL